MSDLKESYNDDSISVLKGATRIRTRPASMLGSSGLLGARHGFIEIYGNALDEHSTGFGDRLDVTYHKDKSISIRDYGRGVPISWNNNENTWNWHTIYNELYGGGKYDKNQEKLKKITDWSTFNAKDYNYLYSVGLNGLGAASTQYTSEFFKVRSYRNGKCYKRDFKRGMPLVEGKPYDMFKATPEEIKALPEEIEDTDEPDGTFIHWKPDDDVFDDTNIGGDWLLNNCKDIAGIAGVTVNFTDEIAGSTITLDGNDIVHLLKQKCGNAMIDNELVFTAHGFTHGKTRVEGDDNFVYVCEADIAFTVTNRSIDHLCYHNSVYMRSGIQYDAIRTVIYDFLTSKARPRGVRLDKSDYESTFCVIISSFSNCVSFRNQTKDAVDDFFISETIQRAFKSKLDSEYAKGNRVLIEAVEKVIENAEIRIATKEQEKIFRDANKVKREKTPLKFVSCDAYEQKRYDEAELWITEGDSAKGSVKEARNKVFQALYPIRGKGLNVTKASLKKILANKEIREIFSLIGTGFDLVIKGEKTFNIDDLKFNKIIFATDADEDGYQIRVLLFLTFYKLAPELIRQGHIYIAETPRFRIDLNNGGYLYARNDVERDKIIKKNTGNIRKISRFKGLGEVNADVLRETTIHPDTRNLIKVDCNFESNVEKDLIDSLFGADKYKQRKDIITAILGCNVADMFDDNALLLETIDNMEFEDDDMDIEEIEL